LTFPALSAFFRTTESGCILTMEHSLTSQKALLILAVSICITLRSFFSFHIFPIPLAKWGLERSNDLVLGIKTSTFYADCLRSN